jgi:hypothetical protein
VNARVSAANLTAKGDSGSGEGDVTSGPARMADHNQRLTKRF